MNVGKSSEKPIEREKKEKKRKERKKGGFKDALPHINTHYLWEG